ncbi:MAG: malto-oligosyltrehalose synthase [Terriglobales bacterium]
MPPTRFPSSTYRLQLNPKFRFNDVRGILDYLHELGISDVYLSPILASRKGSNHGYDVIDPTRLNPDLGSEEEFVALQADLQVRGMGLLIDIVPNHMAASVENPWWMDVLENGAQSAFAAFFDIEWHPHARSLDGRILLPILGRPFGEALDSGEIKLVYTDGRFFLQYFETLLSVSPRSYYEILNYRAERLKEKLAEDSPAYHEYAGILASALELARADRRAADTAAERRLRFESARDRLRMIVNGSPEIAQLVAENVAEINGKLGDPASFGSLQRLLAEQTYKLAFWQNLNESINYRRFFTIADLVGVRVEDPLVFEATHGYILRLVSKTPCTGLRIDHIDGLRDPLAYLNKLRERLDANGAHQEPCCYVLVEKILAPHESLPQDWPVSGTTGYDYLNQANGIFVNPEGARQLEDIYANFIGRRQDFCDVLYQKKKLVMNTLLGVEMRTLGRQLAELAAEDRYARELDRRSLIDALIEVTACLSVYRTYVRNMDVPAQAVSYIGDAVEAARQRAPHLTPGYFNFVREVLLLLNPPHVLPNQREARLAFVMRWQQFTGPIVAKGLEDTALYVYHPLLSLNEVGGNPKPSEATSPETFFSFLQERRQSWPGSLDATSTHDTKRSEDVRARLNVLSEIPQEWNERLDRWANLNAKYKEQAGPQLTPDRNEEYYLYQTLLGVWPLEQEAFSTLLERVQEHLVKATREAMVHTRWTRPNEAHEDALRNFAARILSEDNLEFLTEFREFAGRIVYFGMINGLSQTLLKIAAPGVADFYQGSELWDLRLVDPDNRGSIDFTIRANALKSIAAAEKEAPDSFLGNLLGRWRDGRIKLFLTWKALGFRREHASLFHEGEFLPLQAAGCHAQSLIGLIRKAGSKSVLVVVPRWLSRLPAPSQALQFDWCDTRVTLPADLPKRWTNILTNGEVQFSNQNDSTGVLVADLFREFPVAFFESSD